MDNIQTWGYVTIPKKEYLELFDKKLNYQHLLDAMFSRAKYDPYKGGMEFDQLMMNHILCALETDKFYQTFYEKKSEYEKEMEKLKNEYGNNKSGE